MCWDEASKRAIDGFSHEKSPLRHDAKTGFFYRLRAASFDAAPFFIPRS